MAKRLAKELILVTQKEPIPGVTVTQEGDRTDKWNVTFQGPEGTPYQGAIIRAHIDFPEQYPHKEPVIAFNPILLHVNVQPEDGQPCLEDLINWSPTNKMVNVLKNLYDLIKSPNASHARNMDLAEKMENNKTQYNKEISDWVQKYGH